MTSNPKSKKKLDQGKPVGNFKQYDTVVDQSRAFFRQLRKFGWDLLGTFFLLLASLTLLGILGLTRGTIINSWILLLKRSLGWGSILLVFILAFLGIAVFRHSAGKKFPISFGRVVAIEGMFFTALPLLALFGGLSLDRAIQGIDGGTIGWGLALAIAESLTKPVAIAIYLVLFILFTFIGTGLLRFLINKALEWSISPSNEKLVATGVAERAIQNRRGENNREGSAAAPLDQWRDDRLPPMNLLIGEHVSAPDQGRMKEKALLIETKLAEFGLPVKVIGFRIGPTVTQFALEPGYIERQGPDGELVRQKVKVSQISTLSRDLALALSASRLRIETPVPGRSYVGIEVPNVDSSFVRLRPILESDEFRRFRSPLTIGLGRDVSGETVAVDLEKLPHLLVAGTTNSGKSVCITAITTCLVMNNTPSDLKLVILDPKMVELVRFNGIPHLLGKVETELERMLAVLRWAQTEMDARYRILAEARVRNLESYNQKMLQRKKPTLPRIVILIDELADLMMSAPDQTEHSLIRLAQMARATGIHLVVATQRPSTDVVTGLIKANFPARISFAVASSVDSRVILDSNGAEDLLGKGDMLFLDPQRSGLKRLQGIIVSDSEIEKVMNHWQKMSRSTEASPAPWEELVEVSGSEDSDRLIEQAIAVVKAAGKASTSLLQRRLRVGYPRAARLIDELEEMGIVGPSVGSGRDRDVLVDRDDAEDESQEEEH